MNDSTTRAALVGDRLLHWFQGAGRKNLPWQNRPTAYRVWVSEVMLQQTQVVTVIPYYERFMERFPDVHSLAAAPIDEVLHYWTGLGYYARARNLHRAAQFIVSEYDGVFPDTIEAVQQLPGIGRSTAAAILALSASQRHAILDGNAKRVLARYFGVEGFPGERTVERTLWALAEACTPAEGVARYTQAIMDMGATVCTRARPRCGVCPLQRECRARIEDRQSSLPAARPKKQRPQRTAHIVIVRREDGAVLLERRPSSGLWGGLWTLPQFELPSAAERWTEQWIDTGCDAPGTPSWGAGDPAPGMRVLAAYSHAFTHFDLTLHPVLVRARGMRAVADTDRYCWYDANRPLKIGLTKPTVDLIDQVATYRAAQQAPAVADVPHERMIPAAAADPASFC